MNLHRCQCSCGCAYNIPVGAATCGPCAAQFRAVLFSSRSLREARHQPPRATYPPSEYRHTCPHCGAEAWPPDGSGALVCQREPSCGVVADVASY